MSKVIAVFGAGTGLGASVARRFGREGFRVALVARRKDRLDRLVAQLADEGIEAAAFPADLSDPAGVPALIDAIRSRFGRIDVVEYAPIDSDLPLISAAGLDAATLQAFLPLLLLTPVEVARVVLPEVTERGDGAFLMATGYPAARPVAGRSGPTAVMAAARNWLHTLNGEVGDAGVYAGTLAVASLILNSDTAERLSTPGQHPEIPDEILETLPTVHPDELADYYWDMYTKRDRVEQVHAVEPTPAPASE